MRTPSNYFIFNMACADALLTVYAVPVSTVNTTYRHQWLITGVAGELLCRLSHVQFIGQMSVLISTGSLLVIALDRFFFSGVLSTQENNNSSYRPASDWCHLDFCDRFHGAVIQNDHFSRIQAGLPCLYLQFRNHWLRDHLFIILLPCVSIITYHCYYPHLRCNWIQTETYHSTRQPTPFKSTSTGTDEPQDISNARHCCCCANRLSFSVHFWNDGLFLWLKNCLLLELSVPWLVSGML